jgi:diaminopimelate decarboxylase
MCENEPQHRPHPVRFRAFAVSHICVRSRTSPGKGGAFSGCYRSAIIGAVTASPELDTRFRLSEGQARALAQSYGTPLYVIDEGHLRARVRRYRAAFEAVWQKTELNYASKANSTLAVLAIANQEGCTIDVASEGELRAALAAGVPASHCHLHGNNKTEGEIRFALEQGVSQLIIDNFREIEVIAELGTRSSELGISDFGSRISDIRTKPPTPAPPPSASHKGEGIPGTVFVLRLAPGVDPATHKAISTGQADTKFGFNIADGSAEKALLRCLELGLPIVGFHCHVGSQLLDPEAQETGGALLARFAVEMKRKHGFETSYINFGGGLGVTYVGGEEPISVEEYCRVVVGGIKRELEGSGLEPVLAQEPGRSLIAESVVTLYRVGVIKTVPAPGRGTRTYVAVDGGLSDNPRPVMYQAKYTVLRAVRNSELGTRNSGTSDVGAGGSHHRGTEEQRNTESLEFSEGRGSRVSGLGGAELGTRNSELGAESEATFTVSGKHCETDLLFEDVVLPKDLAEGDLLQVLCTGAYNSSMASNYNRYPRPATALIREDGSHVLVQRRDTWEEMLAREMLPSGLGA